MTELTTHVYTARALPADVPLAVQGGSISLDTGGNPHVTADLTISMTDLANLDPRTGARIEVTAVRDGGTPRVFDLGMREVTPDHASGTISVRAASDEAILSDFAQLDGDEFVRAMTSLRDAVNHVLGFIGEALEPGAVDADITPRWQATNRVLNPVADDVWGYVLGANAKNLNTGTNTPKEGARYITWTSVAAGDANLLIWIDNKVSPGDILRPAAFVRTGTAGRTMALTLRYRDVEGNNIYDDRYTVAAATGTGWSVFGGGFSEAPAGAATVSMFVTGVATAADQTFAVDFPSLTDGVDPVPPFHGSTATDTNYSYVWAGQVSRSVSTRIPFNERRPEALIWDPGVSGMAFLDPLLKAAGIRLVCDEQRRWTLRDDTYVAAGVQAWEYPVNIATAEERLSREDDTFRDGAVYEYTWKDAAGVMQTRYDVFALPGATKVQRFQIASPFPGKGRAERMVRRAQKRGHTVTVSGVPDWTEHTDQEVLVQLPAVDEQQGAAGLIRYSLDSGLVTVTTRIEPAP